MWRSSGGLLRLSLTLLRHMAAAGFDRFFFFFFFDLPRLVRGNAGNRQTSFVMCDWRSEISERFAYPLPRSGEERSASDNVSLP